MTSPAPSLRARPMPGSPGWATLLALATSLFLLLTLGACGSATTADQAQSTAAATAGTRITATARTPTQPAAGALAPASPTTSMRTVRVPDLPAQARQTLVLIAAGGPYPYSKDGSTFGNREGLLPKRPQGFYTEYTVVTPGSDDRGARRIVAGQNGSRFYTDDHYGSFREVIS